MSINIQQLSSRIRSRIEDDRDEQIHNDGQFQVVSESNSNSITSSFRKVTNREAQTDKPAGVVKTVVKGIPEVVSTELNAYLDREAEFRKTATFGQQAKRDLIEKPVGIIKGLGQMILGGLSSTGKTVLEAVYSPILGKEETRQALKGDPKIEKILFNGETKSWQNIKEDVDNFTANSPVATDWEKKHLGITLAVGGFASDIFTGGGKGKVGSKLVKELVDASDDKLVKQILIKNKVPQAVIDDAAGALVKANDDDAVRAVLRESTTKILKEADDAAARAGVSATDEVADLDNLAKRFEGTATKLDEPVNVFHGGDRKSVEKIRKGDFDALLSSELKDSGSGGNRLGLSTTLDRKLARDFATGNNLGNGAEVAELQLKKGSRVLDVTTKEIDDFSEDEIREIAKHFDAIRDVNNFQGESEIRILNNKAVLDDVVDTADDGLVKEAADAISDGENFDDFADGILTRELNTYDEVADAWQRALTAPPETKVADNLPKTKLTPEQVKELEAFDTALINSAPSKTPKPTPENVQKYQDQRGKIGRARDAILEQVQDDMIRVRRLVEDKNLKISDMSNPYDAEIAFHGRVGTRIEDLKLRAEKIDADIVKTAKTKGLKDEQLTKEVNEFLVARHAPERNAALEDGAAGITTKAAKARMAELEKLPHASEIRRIADDIQKINDETLDILKEGEVIDDELYSLLKEKYKSHVPLQRIMDAEDDFAGAMAKGFDVKGSGIKTAKGSQREVNDILGNVVFNHEQAIVRAEKNRVDLSTLKMVRDNKEALSDMFKVRRPKVVGETFSGKPITETITDPRMLVMREKGKPVIIEIKDAQLAIALRGVGRQKLSGIMRGVGAVTRTYSGIHTRFNPEFAFSNKIRDIQEVLVYTASQGELGVKGTAKVAAREARLQNVTAVLDEIRGKNSAGAKMYKEMKANGGTTGGLGLSTRKQIELDIDDIRKMNRSNPRKAAQKTFEYIDHWNTVFEDSSRLSVYRQAREAGASPQRAAVLAKESSVNFNKFGRQGQIINALYMFSNASIQGTTKTVRAMKNPKVAAAVGTAVFGSVAAVAEWNDSIDPDWRNKITTWDRLNSLAIMVPNKDGEGIQYITIPVAWGIKPIKVMADKVYDLASGEGEGLAEASKAVMVSVLEAYNPAGGSDMVAALTPTVLDIPVDTARNKAWHGGAIKPDWDRNAPASIQYFDSLRDSTTGRSAIAVSKGLSGVGIEISPADMHYAYQQLIGGAGRFVDKTVTTINAVGGEETVLPRNVPVVSRFYKTRPDEEIGAGAKEFEQISTILQEQSRERFYLSQQAEDSYQQLKNLPKEEAAKLFEEINEADPALAKKIRQIKKDDEKGLTFIDRKILQLGVGNGERAKFLKVKFDELKTKEEKAQLWTEYRSKGIISDAVSKQLKELLSEGN